jgi:hypothetical protein
LGYSYNYLIPFFPDITKEKLTVSTINGTDLDSAIKQLRMLGKQEVKYISLQELF